MIAYVLIGPALLFYVGFVVLPTVGTLIISFFHWSGTTFAEMRWAGTANYSELAGDSVFRAAILHNIMFLVFGAAFIIVIGLVLAVLLEQGKPGSAFFRAAFFVPSVLSLIVVSLVFSLMASPEFGIVNPLLRDIGLGGITTDWLGNGHTALGSVIASEVWRSSGFAMLIFIAGLKALDGQVLEAARSDGARPFQIVRRITLPLLRPVIGTVLVLVSIALLKLFELVFIMTGGGPNHSSEVLSTWMYTEAFANHRFGYGAAIAVFLLVFTTVVGVIQLTLTRDNT